MAEIPRFIYFSGIDSQFIVGDTFVMGEGEPGGCKSRLAGRTGARRCPEVNTSLYGIEPSIHRTVQQPPYFFNEAPANFVNSLDHMTASSKFSSSNVRAHVVCAKCNHVFHQSQTKNLLCVPKPTTKNCTECCAMCATQRSSSLHLQDSTGTVVVPHVEQHFCNQCPRSFKRPGDLRRHYKKHFTSERRFHCTEESCDRKGAKGFYRRDKLVDHQKKKHGTVVEGMQNMRHALASSESVNPQSYYYSGPDFKGNNLGNSFDGSVPFSPQPDCLDPELSAIDLVDFDFGSLDSDYTAL